jgi:hypothetical protein
LFDGVSEEFIDDLVPEIATIDLAREEALYASGAGLKGVYLVLRGAILETSA